MKLWNHEKNSGFFNFISILSGLIEDNWILFCFFIHFIVLAHIMQSLKNSTTHSWNMRQIFLWIFTLSFWSYSSLCLLSLRLSHIIPRLFFIQHPLLSMLTILEYALIISSVIRLFILFFWIIFFLFACPKRTIDFQRFQLNPQLRTYIGTQKSICLHENL